MYSKDPVKAELPPAWVNLIVLPVNVDPTLRTASLLLGSLRVPIILLLLSFGKLFIVVTAFIPETVDPILSLDNILNVLVPPFVIPCTLSLTNTGQSNTVSVCAPAISVPALFIVIALPWLLIPGLVIAVIVAIIVSVGLSSITWSVGITPPSTNADNDPAGTTIVVGGVPGLSLYVPEYAIVIVKSSTCSLVKVAVSLGFSPSHTLPSQFKDTPGFWGHTVKSVTGAT